MNTAMQEKKSLYIPLFVAGKLSNKKCAELIGISTVSVSRIKKRYLTKGNKAFIHGHCGKPSHNKKFTAKDKKDIVTYYKNKWSYAPYQVFTEYVNSDLGYKISYSSVSNILNDAGMMSPKAHKPVRIKALHKPRPERPCEGELCQLDGCKHRWFMDNRQTCIHGCIDDATHKVTSLYMCENECLMGYQENIKQTKKKFGGFPGAAYTDRSAIFFTTKANLEKCTIQEQLQGYEKKPTQWQTMCKQLKIETIAALSPQAKGRVERMWQTLQGRLPYIFRYKGIKTIQEANIFLNDYIDVFNDMFSIEAKKQEKVWHEADVPDYDYLFSVRSEHTAKADGTFCYHGEKFKVNLPFKTFTLCISETLGIKAYYKGNYYDVELYDPLQDCVSDSMPIVEKDLLRRYFESDTHDNNAKIP